MHYESLVLHLKFAQVVSPHFLIFDLNADLARVINLFGKDILSERLYDLLKFNYLAILNKAVKERIHW